MNDKKSRIKEAYNEDEPKVIEKRNLISRLEQRATEIMELIEGLKADGPKRPFNKKEKALVRNVYLGCVQELATELPIFFMLDNQEAFENAQEALHGWMREIRDL